MIPGLALQGIHLRKLSIDALLKHISDQLTLQMLNVLGEIFFEQFSEHADIKVRQTSGTVLTTLKRTKPWFARANLDSTQRPPRTVLLIGPQAPNRNLYAYRKKFNHYVVSHVDNTSNTEAESHIGMLFI